MQQIVAEEHEEGGITKVIARGAHGMCQSSGFVLRDVCDTGIPLRAVASGFPYLVARLRGYYNSDVFNAGFFDLAVRPEARRRGLASRITRAAAHWALGQGAQCLWAQVAAANIASCQAQLSLGLREVYRYVYFVRPQDKVAALHFG